MKKFLISIDTEGDNLWNWKIGDEITTENARFLPRFQELCEKYGFIPTYLTNYEMATDAFFVDYFKKKSDDNLCEIGMHLHAWNNPPMHSLPVRNDIKPGAPYLIEYPVDVMQKKVEIINDVLENAFEKKMVTHRAGRWAMNTDYFNILDENGYKFDCSVTPMINWEKAPGQSPSSTGSNYEVFNKNPYFVENSGILEIPVTIRENHRMKSLKGCGIRKGINRIAEAKKGYGPLWCRPRNHKENLSDMLYLVDLIKKEKETDYLMFMLHSSEFMPGGSPTFRDNESIEFLFYNLDVFFNEVSKDFVGSSIGEYGANYEK